MNYYSIAAIAHELGVHESPLRRWGGMGFGIPGTCAYGK
jgi:hypothetical protein